MKIYEFGPFRLEPAERRLRRGGTVLPLTPKALDTLLVLVEHAGRAVGKDELMDRVWPGTTVAEATLAQNIFALRKALGDPPHIETVPSRSTRRSAKATPPSRTSGCTTGTGPISTPTSSAPCSAIPRTPSPTTGMAST